MKLFFEKLIKYINNKIKTNEKTIFFAIFLVLIFFILKTLSDNYTISVPKEGGELNEIAINNDHVRYINPVLASNQPEKDLSSLIYSNLMYINKSGEAKKNIATYTVSSDGLIYTLKLDDNIYFSDGKKLTSADVIFTIKSIQNPLIESPLYSNWINIEIKKIDDLTLKLLLRNKYNHFTNFFTLGIIPKHIYENYSPEKFKNNIFNLEPVGSGNFVFNKRIDKLNETIFELTKNKNYNIYIDKLNYHIFNSIKSLENSKLYSNSSKIKNISSIYPNDIDLTEYNINRINIPKIIFIFFNLDNNNFISEVKNRKLISNAISKSQIVDIALEGNASMANSFRPWLESEYLEIKREDQITEIKEEFKKNNWKENKEGFFEKNSKIAKIDIDIINYKEFETVAKIIAKNLSEVGIKTSIIKNSPENFFNKVVIKKDFQTSIFGYDSNIFPDIYFFLSSEFNNPINISNYHSAKINSLTKKIRSSLKRNTIIDDIFSEIENEVFKKTIPITPLYSPNFTYLVDKDIIIDNIDILENKESRFANIRNWYILTEKILPFFKK